MPRLCPFLPDAAEVDGLHVNEAGLLQIRDVLLNCGDIWSRNNIQQPGLLLLREGGARLRGEVLDDEGATWSERAEASIEQRGAVRNVQEDEERHEVVKATWRHLPRLGHGDNVADLEAHPLGQARDALRELLACLANVSLQLYACDVAPALGRDVARGATDARADVEDVHRGVQAEQINNVVIGLDPEVVVLVKVAQGGEVLNRQRTCFLAHLPQRIVHCRDPPIVHDLGHATPLRGCRPATRHSRDGEALQAAQQAMATRCAQKLGRAPREHRRAMGRRCVRPTDAGLGWSCPLAHQRTT
mmetsp:Transcript_120045/g.299437  ORF Transcript_120045/g.299437 Transcript_120045/m.299437 type:complete len:302 (+) Transcript_120045:607-1512(+)